jgi:hypothetical protein
MKCLLLMLRLLDKKMLKINLLNKKELNIQKTTQISGVRLR